MSLSVSLLPCNSEIWSSSSDAGIEVLPRILNWLISIDFCGPVGAFSAGFSVFISCAGVSGKVNSGLNGWLTAPGDGGKPTAVATGEITGKLTQPSATNSQETGRNFMLRLLFL